MTIDGDWFRHQHRLTGVSQSEACRRMNRSPTFLTRIYSGDQPLKLPEAQDLARILGQPLSELLRRAGLSVAAGPAVTESFRPPGFAESDVAPLDATALPPSAESLRPQGLDQSVWVARTDAMRLAGVLPGDQLLVDRAARPRRDDLVLAQEVDWRADAARTLLRLWRAPYLLRPALDPEAPLSADGEKVMVTGVVVALRRDRPPD